jgi:two-component system sensor histidine kinase KdpD
VKKAVRNLRAYLVAVSLTGVATLVLWVLRAELTPANISLLYLLTVLVVAVSQGTKPSLVASLLSFLCFNFFLVKPFYTFHVADPREVIDLFVFFACATLIGQLASYARIQAERAQRSRTFEEADRLKTALLHAVSHDLRTPITIIKTSASNLLTFDATLPEHERIDMLRGIENEADHLNKMVGNLLDISRLKAGALQMNQGLNSLEEVAGDVAARVWQLTHQERIHICFPNSIPLVCFDYGLILQALSNLVENSLRYEPPDTQIDICGELDKEELRVVVRNHGPTILAEERGLLFEPFYHGAGGNIGLGLAIAKGIIEAHGGRLWVEDTPGGGATFVFSLPYGSEVP